MSSQSSKSKQLDDYVGIYLDSIRASSDEGKSTTVEFEVKFGTGRGISRKEITKIDNDNVIQRIISDGFTINSNTNLLRIYPDQKSYRVEISRMSDIIQYCKDNNLTKDAAFIDKVKLNVKRGDGNIVGLDSLDYEDFNFKVSLKTEENKEQEDISNLNKKFRFMNRTTFIKKNGICPLQIDISVVKTSTSPTFIGSNIMNSKSKTTYEIEIELLNDVCAKMNANAITSYLRNTIKLIMGGFQNSNFPISNTEQKETAEEYMGLIWGKGKKYNVGMKIMPKHFMGPSSFTLQIPNIIKTDRPVVGSGFLANITIDYTVTEKADGERKLLFINNNGRLYFISTNMNIQFTGITTTTKSVFNTIIDGEHITHDKNRLYINLYAAFDIYYLNGSDVRKEQFSRRMESDQVKGRLELLNEAIGSINTKSEKGDVPKKGTLRISVKRFYPENKQQSIFECCRILLDKKDKDEYEYNTDGLIFTPMKMAVGQKEDGYIPLDPEKRGWEFSLKWKPPEFNTIDFLVTTRKTAEGKDFIGVTGDDLNVDELKRYKSLELRVGFNEKDHGYIDPVQTIIDGSVHRDSFNEDVDGYRPVKFYPTNPTIENAHICNIKLSIDNSMLSEEDEIIEDKMIVECRYDDSENDGWKWKPLRVRYDKTAEFRNGGKNFGNPYHVANSNWNTIHHPISIEMLKTGSGIENNEDEEVYYKKTTADNTRGLRNFHNKYVKSKLLGSVSQNQSILIDYAVGKGGDLPKWLDSRLKFVFGIDISVDNIQNRMDGACARFLNQTRMRHKFRNNSNLAALFVVGDSSKNIRNTEAIAIEKYKKITNAVMGKGTNNEKDIGKGVVTQWGIGSGGFDISSIQFAIHYMFKNLETLFGFLRNVYENTKLNGYFIGTCYDGEKVFDLLKINSNVSIYTSDEPNEKIWEIVKKYDNTTFRDDASCLGYTIDVFQESIGKYFEEYLVNFKFLDNVLRNFGFVKLSTDEAQKMGLPSGSGMFEDLFKQMNNNQKQNRGAAYRNITMTDEEKQISFLNRYFVYVKRFDNVNLDKVQAQFLTTINPVEEKESIMPQPIKKAQASAAPPMAEEEKSKTSIGNTKKIVIMKTVKKQPANVNVSPLLAEEEEEEEEESKMKESSKESNTKQTTKQAKAQTEKATVARTQPRVNVEPTLKNKTISKSTMEIMEILSQTADAIESAKVAEKNEGLIKRKEGRGLSDAELDLLQESRDKLQIALYNALAAINKALADKRLGKYIALLIKSVDSIDRIELPVVTRIMSNQERASLISALNDASINIQSITKDIANVEQNPSSSSSSVATLKQTAGIGPSSGKVVKKITRKVKVIKKK